MLDRPLDQVEDVLRTKKPQRLPVVFTREEVRAVLALMHGDKAVMASVLYGSGLRLMECLCSSGDTIPNSEKISTTGRTGGMRKAP